MNRSARVVATVLAVVAVLLVATAGDLGGLRQRLLIHAATRGDITIMRGLLGLGADAAADSPGGTPLYAAAWAGHPDAIEVLLAHGADVNLADASGVTPLMAAATQGHDETVRLLARRGASLTATCRCGNALDIALANHHESTAAILRTAGAVPSRRSQ
jgi:uncharacterized protein